MSFDGSDDQLANPLGNQSITGAIPRTVSYWAYYTKNQNYGTTLNLNNGAGATQYTHHRTTDGRHYVSGSSLDIQTGAGVLPLSNWLHVVSVYYGNGITNATLYTNGASVAFTVAAGSGSAVYATGTNVFRIGGNGGANAYFAGFLDDFRAYPKALPVEDVLKIYNSTKGKYIP